MLHHGESQGVNLRFLLSLMRPEAEESLHVVGNVPELGFWRPTDGNRMFNFMKDSKFFKLKLSPQSSQKDIEFKYVKARRNDNGDFDIVEWERGQNRQITALEMQKLDHITNEDEWSRRKVTIRLVEESEENTSKYSVHICSDVFPNEGNLMLFRKMKPVIKKVFEQLRPLWEIFFYIDVDIDHFYYTYALFYREERRVFIDRERYRVVALNQATRDPKIKDVKNALLLSNKTFYKIDRGLNFTMPVYQLDQKIFFGDYPQSADDFRLLFEKDIKVVFNLMTHQEIDFSLLDVGSLKKEAEKSHITYVGMEYDNCLSYPERLEKLRNISVRLHQMLLKGETIYICEMFGINKIREVLTSMFDEHLTKKKYTLNNHAVLFNP